ncbi:MAG: metal-dependent hydrolase [Chitinophagales bacterium]|nr:metal-dependent hydrolase [Chitinophagales bacterium]
MDSLTQFVLGAGVGELTAGKKLGWKAQLIGGLAGTIPDLDVFASSFINGDELTSLRTHRAYSHALFVHLFLAIPFAYLFYRLFKRKLSFTRWYLLFFLGFATHTLLDCCTTYGTQLLLPFTHGLIAFNNIAVIDPLYTLPFMFLLIACLCFRKESKTRRVIAIMAFVVSCGYLSLATFNKYLAHQSFKKALAKEHIQYTHLSTSPTMFNALLWAGIAYNDSVIYCGEQSVFRLDDDIKLYAFKRNLDLEKQYASEKFNTLKWFSNGYYFLQMNENDTLDFYNIKWGRTDLSQQDNADAANSFRFYTKLYKDEQGNVKASFVRPPRTMKDIKQFLSVIYSKIFEK